MGNVKTKDKKKYADMWTKSTAEPTQKKAAKPLVEGKAQARIESMGWDQTSKDNDCIKVEMKCLTGPNEGRTMYRTFYIQGDDEEKTAVNIDRFKEEMGRLGVSKNKSPDEAMESLEECIIEVSVWRGKDKKDKYPIIFFNKFIKGPEEKEEKLLDPVTSESTLNKVDADDVEY